MSGSTYQIAAGAWTAGTGRATANQVNDMATNGNVFALQDVTMNLGTAVSPDDATYEESLVRCQRYYYRLTPAVSNAPLTQAGYATSTTAFTGIVKFPVTMRTAPSALEQTGTATDYRVAGAGAATTTCSSVPTFGSATVSQANTVFTVASGLTAYNAGYAANASGVTAAYLGWSADL
jgi:hypothetical protein